MIKYLKIKKKEFVVKKFIFALSVAILFLVGCSSNSKKSEEKAAQKNSNQEPSVQKSIEQEQIKKVKPKVEIKHKEDAQELRKKVQEATASAKEVVKKSAQDAKKKIQELAAQAKGNELVQQVSQQAQAGIKALESLAVADKTSKNTQTKGTDAKELYSKCAGCHGNKAQNKALGVSKVIAGWDAKKIENALQGYKAGTYGGSMKSIMKGQVLQLKDSDIKALAEYISHLK